MAKHACDVGQELQRWIYPGHGHAGVIAFRVADMIFWIADRFANAIGRDPHVSIGLSSVAVAVRPS